MSVCRFVLFSLVCLSLFACGKVDEGSLFTEYLVARNQGGNALCACASALGDDVDDCLDENGFIGDYDQEVVGCLDEAFVKSESQAYGVCLIEALQELEACSNSLSACVEEEVDLCYGQYQVNLYGCPLPTEAYELEQAICLGGAGEDQELLSRFVYDLEDYVGASNSQRSCLYEIEATPADREFLLCFETERVSQCGGDYCDFTTTFETTQCPVDLNKPMWQAMMDCGLAFST